MHKTFVNRIMSLSKRISDLRQKKGFKQSEMAALVDLSQSSYSRIENNPETLTLEQLEKLAKALDVSVIELITGEPPKIDDGEREKKLENEIKQLKEWLEDKETIINYHNKAFSNYVVQVETALELLENIDLEKAGFSYEEIQAIKAQRLTLSILNELMKAFSDKP